MLWPPFFISSSSFHPHERIHLQDWFSRARKAADQLARVFGPGVVVGQGDGLRGRALAGDFETTSSHLAPEGSGRASKGSDSTEKSSDLHFEFGCMRLF